MAYPPTPPDQIDRQTGLPMSTATGGSPMQLPAGPAPAPPPPFPGYMSPQELAALAAKTIADAYAPQLAYMQQQQQRAQQMSQAQQSGLAELYKIIAGSYSGLGGQITGIYDKGANDLGQLPSDIVTGDVPVSQQIVGSGGLAGPGYGDAYPRLAGQQGQVEFLKAVQEGNATQADYTDQIAKLMAEEPGKVQQVLSDLNSQQSDLAKAGQAAGPIIRSVGGNLVAVDPRTGKISVLYQGPSSSKNSVRSLANGQLQAVDAQGRPVGKPFGPTRPTNEDIPHTKSLGGKIYQWDPATKQWYDTGVGPGRAPKAPAGVDLSKSKIAGQWVDKNFNPVRVPAGTPPPPKSGGRKPASAATIKNGWKTIQSSYYHPIGSSQRLTDAQLQQKLDNINKGHPQNQWITIDQIPSMSAAQKRALGIDGVRRNPQEVYIDLVRSGISVRRAVQMMQKAYPGFGEGYVTGKGDAAGQAAYSPRAAARQTQPVSYSSWPDMIRSGAAHYGLDALAVLAVANAEGLGGGVGDTGTSFGPFQLHVGGALPKGKNQAWAESPAGIDYALRKISSVARGKTGRAAVEAIVRMFERPKDPAGEIERAWNYYQSQFA